MKKLNKNKIAKILAVVYIVFISIIAFDVKMFSIGFLVHMIPSIIFLACLITAWFKPEIGGILFVVFGIITIFFFKTYTNFLSLITISLIPLIIGYLFLSLKFQPNIKKNKKLKRKK